MNYCIYCHTTLVDRYCPVCEPVHFIKTEDQSTDTATSKGKARKPGPFKD